VERAGLRHARSPGGQAQAGRQTSHKGARAEAAGQRLPQRVFGWRARISWSRSPQQRAPAGATARAQLFETTSPQRPQRAATARPPSQARQQRAHRGGVAALAAASRLPRLQACARGQAQAGRPQRRSARRSRCAKADLPGPEYTAQRRLAAPRAGRSADTGASVTALAPHTALQRARTAQQRFPQLDGRAARALEHRPHRGKLCSPWLGVERGGRGCGRRLLQRAWKGLRTCFSAPPAWRARTSAKQRHHPLLHLLCLTVMCRQCCGVVGAPPHEHAPTGQGARSEEYRGLTESDGARGRVRARGTVKQVSEPFHALCSNRRPHPLPPRSTPSQGEQSLPRCGRCSSARAARPSSLRRRAERGGEVASAGLVHDSRRTQPKAASPPCARSHAGHACGAVQRAIAHSLGEPTACHRLTCARGAATPRSQAFAEGCGGGSQREIARAQS